MPSASVKKKISCSKENLIEMVLDIERYPEFVPWCLNAKVHNIKNNGDLVEIIADLTIGKSFFNETYQSFVTYNKKLDLILVKNINGPIKHLENKWFFKSLGKNSEIDFFIDFELKSKILNLFMIKSFDKGLNKIVDAFEQRAITLFKNT
jgi:coenzyme Q-binding protein COQ10